jgi:formate hydrogenlyase subunit 3/multisubunit Na+/H+ antiporter MnhD subunit
LISLPVLLLLLLAIILKQRELAITAAGVIILLNIVRFGIDGFVLVTLAFKTSPVDGVLFFIPPFTFYYLNKRGGL